MNELDFLLKSVANIKEDAKTKNDAQMIKDFSLDIEQIDSGIFSRIKWT